MAYKGNKIIVIMPAYNAEKTLVRTYNDLPLDFIDEVILVDDASTDETVRVAKQLRLILVEHKTNRGYGGNQKTCYSEALRHGADIIIMVHPDHQYDPKFIPEMVKLVVDENYSAVFGSRMKNKGGALSGGMPVWKFVFNMILTKYGNLFLGTNLTEFHSGFRAYNRRVFENIDIERNSDNFVFDTQIIIQLISHNIQIKEIPITTRYFDEASQIKLKDCIIYGTEFLTNILFYKLKIKKF